jgi:hypothetical protein
MSESNDLVIRDGASAVSIYGEEAQVREMVEAVRAVAPWVHGKEAQTNLTDGEVVLVVRRAIALGLDPLNPHEVQIWKDKRGTVNFQLSYTLMSEWVRRFKGTHTSPRYHTLTKAEMAEEGLLAGDMAIRVSFVMDTDFVKLLSLVELYGPEEAREMITVTGLGVATSQELNSGYFAPAGRSKAWKIQKRALVDAYRKKFGTPTRAEIEELRRSAGTDRIMPEDWEGTAELAPESASRLAAFRAGVREIKEQEENDPEFAAAQKAQAADAMAAMFPGAAPIVEGIESSAESDPDPESANAQEAAEAMYPEAMPEESPARDLWDAEESRRFVASAVKVLTAKTGKPYLLFCGDNIAAGWFGGRDKLLQLAPWVGSQVTKEQLGEVGAEIPLAIGVVFETSGQYLNAVSFYRV